jgi:S1-C subfamily serine protease
MAVDYCLQGLAVESLVRGLVSASMLSVDDVGRVLAHVDVDIHRLIARLVDRELIRFDRSRSSVSLTGLGKELNAQRCAAEFVLGLSYCRWKYEQAVVRIIVSSDDGGESAGSGFFVQDPPNRVVTNRHVVANRRIISINDKQGQKICDHGAQVVLGPSNLDLAFVECETPSNILPFRIDWRADAVDALDDVLVLGYPYIPLHQPELFAATGQVGMYASQLSSNSRKSLIVTRIAAPGCSGGPVLGPNGLVVGIVEGEPQLKTSDGTQPSMLCAIPARYLRELL